MLTRRNLIGSGLAAFGTTALSRIAFAKPLGGTRRFIFIIQRGAADGLHSVAPIGDPGLRAARASLVDAMGAPLKLDAMFALHPALAQTGALYASGEALFVHAVASANRDRSHFDAQNILETGGPRAYAEKSGWLNRLVALEAVIVSAVAAHFGLDPAKLARTLYPSLPLAKPIDGLIRA